jgi:cytochrome b6
MSEPEHFEEIPEEKKKWMPFFPNFLLRDLLLWLIVLGILLFLSVYYPWDLGFKADPFASAPAGIKPEWYFMFMFQTLKYIPAHMFFIEGEIVGVLLFGIAGIAWMLVPFFEIKAKREKRLNLMTIIGLVSILYIIIMTIIGYLS